MNGEQKHQNSYGKTISVRHFFNTNLKSTQVEATDSQDRPLYPLYLQVKVKRQSTTIKSQIFHYANPEDFDAFFNSAHYKSIMNDEAVLITKHILADKPFERTDFKLAGVLNDFDFKRHSMLYVIGECLREEYIKARSIDLAHHFKQLHSSYSSLNKLRETLLERGQESHNKVELERFTRAIEEVKPENVYSLVRADMNESNPHVNKLAVVYGMPLLMLDELSLNISVLGSRIFTFALYRSSEFETIFMNLVGDRPDLELLRNGVERLMNQYPQYSAKAMW